MTKTESLEFIGRGEKRTVCILKRLYPHFDILIQVPFTMLAPNSNLAEKYKKHKHDIVVFAEKPIVVEANFKHGKIAKDKWKVFAAHLKNSGCIPVEINDNECASLFDLKDGKHTDTWQDWLDVISALKTAGANSI